MNKRPSPSAPAPSLPRQYDKGEKRYKHVGRQAEAAVDTGNPKKVVGKCPKTVPEAIKLQVLNDAIAELPEEADDLFPSRMFGVYEGVVYDCRTTTVGESYHAFPYHGELLRTLHDRLAQTADAKRHVKAFKRWIAKHVKVIG